MKRKRIFCPKCKKRIIPEHFACDYPYIVSDSCPECGYIISEVVNYETVGPNTRL